MLPTGYFNQTFRLLKSKIGQYLCVEAKKIKVRPLYFLKFFIFEIKVTFIFFIFGHQDEIWTICGFDQSTYLAEIIF